MNKYETIFIINPNIESGNAENIIQDVQNLITGSGGEVKKLDKWGKKRLAYDVKGNKEGNYVLINFEADPQFIERLQRYYGLTEQIIKYITVRAEKLPETGREAIVVKAEDEERPSRRFKADEEEDEGIDYGEEEDE